MNPQVEDINEKVRREDQALEDMERALRRRQGSRFWGEFAKLLLAVMVGSFVGTLLILWWLYR